MVPNPYQSPSIATEEPVRPRDRERRPGFSVFMIAAGLFFCLVSFYTLFGHGIGAFLANYRTLGAWVFGFMNFYGFAGGFTACFHLSYLIVGRPRQHLAGIWAIAISLMLTGAAIVALECLRPR
jgi:hypothetical protein